MAPSNRDKRVLADLKRERERVDQTCRFWARCAITDGDGSEADDNYNEAHAAGVMLDHQIEELEARIRYADPIYAL